MSLDTNQLNAEMQAYSLFQNMKTLEQIYSFDRNAVAGVGDILRETSDMLVSMVCAIHNREAANASV